LQSGNSLVRTTGPTPAGIRTLRVLTSRDACRSSLMKNVTIVCDGSSLGNGTGVTRAAAVAVLGFKGIWKAFGEYLGNATNQQAEIAAAIVGLKNLKEPCKVHLLSDSRYV